MITATPREPPAGPVRPRWNSALNLTLLGIAVVLVVAAGVLGFQVLYFRHRTAVLHAAAAAAKPVTKESASDVLPPSGKGVLTFSGTGARTSEVHVLDFSWAGAWSANCGDESGGQVLRISLHAYPSGAQVASFSFPVSGYQSGSLPGRSIARGYFVVSSACDWSLTVVNTELPSP